MALLSACSANKFIPEGQYLLDDVEVVSENRSVTPSSVNNFIRQKPNSKWFNLMKVPLGFYCLSGKDSTSAVNGFFRKIGEAPEIYDHLSAIKSRNEIENPPLVPGSFLPAPRRPHAEGARVRPPAAAPQARG